MQHDEYIDQSTEISMTSALSFIIATVLVLATSMFIYAQLFQSLMI